MPLVIPSVRLSRLAAPLCFCLAVSACDTPKPRESATFYERKIEPILQQTCANSPTQSGCHVAADTHGNAFGNLDVTSYASLSKRHDLLVSYGPYLMPGLLAKVAPPFQVRITTWEDGPPIVVTTDIPHAGGSLVDVTSTSFDALSRWIARGATENNSERPPKDLGRTPCAEEPGTDPAFDPTTAPATLDFDEFESKVNTVLSSTCAAGNCHGSPSNSMYLTCGKTDAQIRWNYFVASDYVAGDPQSSELLRRPLSPASGGTYHEGGTLFESASDPGYEAILDWAGKKGAPKSTPSDAGFSFFANRVQPMLVKKGCMLLGCHSPAMGHDYRLTGGSGGHFGLPATRRNYQLSLMQVALDSPDPNASRILRKNLQPVATGGAAPAAPLGILHRGGALFGLGDSCTDPDAAENGDLDAQNPYCVIRRWIEIERASRMSSAAGLSAIVYVKRKLPPGKDAPQDFETFTPGADLVSAPASLDPASHALSVEAGSSLLSQCGLAAGIDVRRPAVSWDGKKIAFSARTSEGEPWRIYVIDGSSCAVEPTIDAPPVDEQGNLLPTNGELVHNFDPAFAPDGRIVFVSTRGNVTNATLFDYQGPQRTPADPSRLNANLYVREDDGGSPRIRQLTFLLNQELLPSFMSDGRLVMTTEKRAKGFYQLAGRRQNLDGGDYHPLFGQRATIGYHQVTDITELSDKDFVAIFSNKDAAHGAGALGIVNRSLGVDQQSTTDADYLQDPKAKDWPNPEFFQHSVRIFDGQGGVYRNPTRLPNGHVLVSYAPGVPDVTSFDGHFQLYVVDAVTGERTGPVVQDADSLLWPAAVYERHSYGVYASKLDEVNGSTRISGDPADLPRADVTFLDAPLLVSLLFQNTRSRRIIPSPMQDLEVWEDLPPEPGVTGYDSGGAFVVSDDFGKLYVRRRKLGVGRPEVDGSLHVRVPGGAPLVLAPLAQLVGDSKPVRHHQLEEMQFYPGEIVRQGFQRGLFDGVCAGCHGAVSGYDADISANPDILTQASRVKAMSAPATTLLDISAKPSAPPFP